MALLQDPPFKDLQISHQLQIQTTCQISMAMSSIQSITFYRATGLSSTLFLKNVAQKTTVKREQRRLTGLNYPGQEVDEVMKYKEKK